VHYAHARGAGGSDPSKTLDGKANQTSTTARTRKREGNPQLVRVSWCNGAHACWTRRDSLSCVDRRGHATRLCALYVFHIRCESSDISEQLECGKVLHLHWSAARSCTCARSTSIPIFLSTSMSDWACGKHLLLALLDTQHRLKIQSMHLEGQT
jgi:hypothetical protein